MILWTCLFWSIQNQNKKKWRITAELYLSQLIKWTDNFPINKVASKTLTSLIAPSNERSHTGIKPYTCIVCDTSFAEWGNWKRHELIHSGVKAFACQFCESKFIDMAGKKQHEKMHTGEKAYTCKFCDKSYITKNKMKKHVLTKHADENPPNSVKQN